MVLTQMAELFALIPHRASPHAMSRSFNARRGNEENSCLTTKLLSLMFDITNRTMEAQHLPFD